VKTKGVERMTGIDLLIACGPDLDAVVRVLVSVANIERTAIMLPGEMSDRLLEVLEHPFWAAIYTYDVGEFGFKVDLDGRSPRDYHAIGSQIARALDVCIAWPDERTLATTAFILCAPDGSKRAVSLVDTELEGFAVQPAAGAEE
jgi:hypothetical protein